MSKEAINEKEGMKSIEEGTTLILKGLNQELDLDLTDVNFKDTPKRVARAFWEIFSGLKDTEKQIDSILSSKFPGEGYDQMIISKQNKAFSMCPHHLLPVEYDIDIGYIPSAEGFVLGISKLSRIALVLARRPVMQETFTKELGEALEKVKPLGVMIRVTGIHYCMRMRGAKQLASTITSYTSGVFRDKPVAREEFMLLIK
jgi:GTP cyclohydrolase I